MKMQKAYKKNVSLIAVERPPMKLERLELRQMRRSKLELYVDILRELAHTGPMKLTHIMYKTNISDSELEEYLNFLIKQDLVEQRNTRKNRMVFAVTERGMTVLRYLRELTQATSVVKEN